MRVLLLLIALLLAACTRVETPQRSSLQLIDLTDDFAAFQERSASMDPAARVEAFKAHFATILPGFYSTERVRSPRYNDAIRQALQNWPSDRAAIEQVSRGFSNMLAPAQASFEREFGPLTGYPPIFLVHSLGEFDGGTRSLPGGSRLMFGADMIARIYSGISSRPFFHHELFHLYHERRFGGCSQVWCDLWGEGLATYVSHRLNPRATDAELLLTIPVPLREAVERDRRTAVCAALSRLDSSAREDLSAMFSNGRIGDLPGRFGYYVGYLVAAEAGRTRSLQQLAAMPQQEVRPLVEASLRSMAQCPA
jgi:hypothetical protein